jgi:hypothetical protein
MSSSGFLLPDMLVSKEYGGEKNQNPSLYRIIKMPGINSMPDPQDYGPTNAEPDIAIL